MGAVNRKIDTTAAGLNQRMDTTAADLKSKNHTKALHEALVGEIKKIAEGRSCRAGRGPDYARA